MQRCRALPPVRHMELVRQAMRQLELRNMLRERNEAKAQQALLNAEIAIA